MAGASSAAVTCVVVTCLVVAALWLSAGAALGQGSPTLAVTATINGRDVESIDANRPLRLDPDREAVVRLEVANRSDRPVMVRTVRLDGRVLGLTFYTFDTRVDLRLDPRGSGEREFAVDIADLRGQASGLLPSRLALLDDRREVLAAETFPVDVQASMMSVYGLFGATVAGITALLLIAALVRLATHTLPRSRWSRATRFGVPGIGIGLALTFSLSAFRVLIPDASTWFPLVAIGGLVGFVVGYLTPTPENRDDRYEEVVDASGRVVRQRRVAELESAG
jgi:hypothetical protein